jgi:hypothetical protein
MAGNIQYNPSTSEIPNAGTSNAGVPNIGGLNNPFIADSRFVTQLRDQKFFIETYIYNQVDGFKPFPIPVYFIEELEIEESLDNWVSKGFLTLNTEYEMFERGALSKVYGDKQTPQIQAPLVFRTDGRNKIGIRIIPIEEKNSQKITQKDWEMSFDLAIYDIEDLETENSSKKLRKFYFWDERFQIFCERNISWSTGLSAVGNDDASRTLPASMALQSIISTAVSNNFDIASMNSDPNNVKVSSPMDSIAIGNILGPSQLDKPLNKVDSFNYTNWNPGSPDSIIFYTSPANSTVIDDIQYISKNLKADDGSPLFLRLDRWNNPAGKMWSLVSLKQLFTNAAANQIERLVIQDAMDMDGSKPYIPRAPFGFTPINRLSLFNFQSPIASKIESYKFVPMVAKDDMRFTNSPTHNFNFSSSSFIINFSNNRISDFLKKMQDVASGLHSYNNSKQLLLNINNTKSKAISVSNKFIPRTFFPPDLSLVNMMKDFLFLGQTIYFTAMGLTFRTPGKIIFIDRESSTGEKNPFDDRFLGQWMITKIKHNFTKENYINEVYATKIDIFNKWWNELDSDVSLFSTKY